MDRDEIRNTNKKYWDSNADLWFGATTLPTYGIHFVTEEELHLFGDVSGKKLLEICCGSGHSLKYHGDRGAAELWGVDFSQKQINNADAYLQKNGYTAKLICDSMEAESDIPTNYFDFVYSIYGIGWSTDLQETFKKIATYLVKDGIFIFSWHHPLNYCVAWSREERKDVVEKNTLIFNNNYFDEAYFTMPADGSEIILCNRKMSTYINALAQAGFVVEEMVEETDEETMETTDELSDKMKKAKMFPITFCIKARKL